ncbi:L-rhamnose isomerase [Enterococcus malodoratus]|uniref:L-rhamnose isomerase n=1 Tax=Enterococcus malodoratus ATCC 43197 TaxID=1158601 RepID=R2P2X9_9ENTE|nr:L-rhamnose isomerase [Enterococcus malodoratus]BBM16863.1 L-rhamnose isomerase [Enterococcus avium]EOH77578.1 L-rhamnose isomerase [Enterococcus malodoratus ATCC 43197]EOT64008.1 L-rhamnose isomerase [Enterococcus malodoratus ATCC 43197]OJG62012.1 L-rhamnose isomerase [Enterococcus malodoratus]SET70982.1 L-rhamnose isomerase [Enterococcus malodoratus]
MTKTVEERYEDAKARYAEIGVDTDAALKKLQDVKISMHCWQGDDVKGFLNPDGELTGGIMATGDYPGAAHTPDQLRQDVEKAFSLIPGSHKLNLHAIYLDTDEPVDLDEIEPKHFAKWASWANEQGVGLDFNPTFFSHPMMKDGMTLAHPDKEVRDFWIEHGKRSRKIAEYLGKETGQTCIDNFWMPDGMKDNPIDRYTPRKRMMESLDEIFAEDLNEEYTQESVESKLFGLGAEAYTVGSHEFYMGYGLTRNKLICLDAGHFHPTEVISNKLTSLALFSKGIMLHVSRPVRWDSDHVVIMDDELQEIGKEIVRNDLLGKTNIGLDFFDATINRIAAWVIGTRNTQKALLKAMLEPIEDLKTIELDLDYTKRMALTEELKDFPYADVWNYFCEQNNAPVGMDWYEEVMNYERDILSARDKEFAHA